MSRADGSGTSANQLRVHPSHHHRIQQQRQLKVCKLLAVCVEDAGGPSYAISPSVFMPPQRMEPRAVQPESDRRDQRHSVQLGR